MTNGTLRVIELFFGIGSQRMALSQELIPHRVVAISEIDKYALRSYEAIYGDCPNLGDISKVPSLPPADIMTYSFPCQAISQAGRKTGMAKGSGTSSSLLWEVERLLRVTARRPKWLIMENVPMIHSAQFLPDFQRWCAILESLGYQNRWGDLNACNFGSPQNRKRTFMVSRLGRDPPPLPVGGKCNKVLGDVLEHEVDEKYYLSDARLVGLMRSSDKERQHGNNFRFKPKTADDIASTVTTSAGRRKTDNYLYDRCMAVDMVDTRGFECKRRVYATDALSPTETTDGRIKIMDGGRVRRLTPRECWRLQGFPDWSFDRVRPIMSDTQLYRQAGNAINVDVMRAIFRTIVYPRGRGE